MPYFFTSDSCKLYYTTHNFESSRPLVVFLNGTSQTTIYWEQHVTAFSERFGVLRYDARSQGQSDMGTRRISADSFGLPEPDLAYHSNHKENTRNGLFLIPVATLI